jgi:hypothetical protein
MVLIISGWGNLAHFIPSAFFVLVNLVLIPENAAIVPTPNRIKTNQDDSATTAPEQRQWRLSDYGVTREFEHVKAVRRAKVRNFFIACLLASPVIWFVGRFLNRSKFKLNLDTKSGEQVEIQFKGGHKMFWIPLEYWSFFWLLVSFTDFFL